MEALGTGPSSGLAGAPSDTSHLAVGGDPANLRLISNFLCTLECDNLNLFRWYEALDFPDYEIV